MNEHADPALDALLRRAFEGPVADDGFVARVMSSLPPRPQRRAWSLPAAAVIGGLLAWVALATSPFAAQVVREWHAADVGAGSAVLLALVLVMGLLGCAWAVEEGP